MREIPSEVATLLKSRSMIGENRPVTKLLMTKEQCTGSIRQGDTNYTEDLYMMLPTEKLLYSDINSNAGSNFDISPIYFHQKIEFKLWVNNTSSWKYQSDSSHCKVTQINVNTVQLCFEDYNDADFNDAIVEIASPNGLTVVGQEIMVGTAFIGIDIKSANISRSKGMASSLNLILDNKDGKYSPDKVGAWRNVFFPNAEIVIEQGYGKNTIRTFDGLIDSIEMTTFPQLLKITCRDKLKLALDQIITMTTEAGNVHVITYTNQTIEAMFKDLCNKAGLSTGTIEATGLTLAAKTFSWESYADCFSWLADLVGFEYVADETGLINFKRETMLAETTAVYTFKEGEDIISLGYTINDNDIYYKVVVYGKDANDNVLFASTEYVSKGYYNVLSQKFLKIDISEASTVEQLQAIADRVEKLMRSRVREVFFAAIAVPWLQVGDVIRVIESSTTISELYRITDMSTNYDSNGYTMQITCYHHSI